MGPFVRQAWTVSAVWWNMIGQGMMLSYTSSLLPGLKHPDSNIKVDLHTASWIASSCGISAIPGFLISSFLMDYYGRKIAHLILILPGLAGWFAIYFGQNVAALVIGRVLGGITAGATVSLGAIVIGEYSNPRYRGVFLNLKTASVCFGGMLVHIFGHFLHWRIVALISAVPYAVAVLVVGTWLESPAWLASKGEFEKSEKSFYWFRGKSEESSKELNELIKAQREKLSKPNVETSFTDSITEFFKKFTRRDFLIPSCIVMVGAILLDMSGRHTFPAYALQIIGELTDSKAQSFYYTLGIDIIITTSAISSSIIVKVMKRRTLLFSTGFAAVAVLMLVCTYLTLLDNNIMSSSHDWIPIAMFVVFFSLANLGCTPIPLALLGEVFPLAHRGAGSIVAGIWLALGMVIGLQTTPFLLAHLKVQGTFFVFGIAMAICLAILYFILPETKDRTLQEIEDYFNYGKFRDDGKDSEETKLKSIKS